MKLFLIVLILVFPTGEASPKNLKETPKVWQRLAYCESRNNPRAISPSGQHYGLWQIHRGFYITLGYNYKKATFAQQWKTAKYVYARQGAKAWSCARYAGLK